MKNPHAREDGMPRTGQLQQYLDWEAEQEQKRLQAMTPTEQRKEKAAQKNMQDKMNS